MLGVYVGRPTVSELYTTVFRLTRLGSTWQHLKEHTMYHPDICVCVEGRNRGMAKKLHVPLLWVGFVALALVGMCQCSVTCNEYDTCFSVEKQVNLTEAIRHGHRQQACFVATTAMDCLDEARKDCNDVRYHNLPRYILKELDDKRHNMSAYTTTYCGSNGGDVRGVSIAVTVGWTLLSVLLCVH